MSLVCGMFPIFFVSSFQLFQYFCLVFGLGVRNCFPKVLHNAVRSSLQLYKTGHEWFLIFHPLHLFITFSVSNGENIITGISNVVILVEI